MTGPSSSARDFLRRNSVPLGSTPSFGQWLDECRKLGPGSAPGLLDALEHGDDSEQYGALVCLRQFGYEAWGVGYDSELYYTVRSPDGEEQEIVPDQR